MLSDKAWLTVAVHPKGGVGVRALVQAWQGFFLSKLGKPFLYWLWFEHGGLLKEDKVFPQNCWSLEAR